MVKIKRFNYDNNVMVKNPITVSLHFPDESLPVNKGQVHKRHQFPHSVMRRVMQKPLMRNFGPK